MELKTGHREQLSSRTSLAAMLILLVALFWPRFGFSASNTAVDAGGLGLSASGTVTVTSVRLGLVKQARDLSGTVLPGGSDVAVGTQIYFVLYLDNSTAVTATDIQLNDLLNETQFTYVVNSLESTVVASASSDAAIWAGSWSFLTDELGGPDDLASITDSDGPVGLDRITIGAVSGQVNQGLNIIGSTLRAIRFRVTVN